MRHIIIRNIIFGCSLCFSRLTDAASVELAFPAPQVSNLSFTLNDTRPPKQLKTGPEAFSVGNCAYSSIRVGDDLFNPSKVDLISERLQRNYSVQLTGKTVIIENFVIHRNFAKQRRDEMLGTKTNVVVTENGTPNAGLGVIGGITAGIVNKAMANAAPMSCAPDDLRGGYSPEETPNDVAPIVIVIDLIIDKTPIHVRTVYEPVLRIEGEKPVIFIQRSFTAAMTEFLDKLTREMNSKIGVENTGSP